MKKAEWAQRSEVRENERKAIAAAVEILSKACDAVQPTRPEKRAEHRKRRDTTRIIENAELEGFHAYVCS